MKADLIITNANVYTVDDDNPQAEAVAVGGNKILFVGSAADAEKWRGPNTKVIDGQKRTLLPGFIDSHFHLEHGAMGMGDIQLYEVASLAELKTAVRAFVDENPGVTWLRGQGLRYGIPSVDEPLNRHHLDEIEPDLPLVLLAYDVHTAWANSAALERSGLLHGTEPLPGSAEVMMGADGLATGEVREDAAFDMILQQIPAPDEVRKRELMQKGLQYLASLGVTSVHNMDGDEKQAAMYAALEDLGQLSLRIYIPYSVKPETPFEALAAEAVSMRQKFDSAMVRSGCVKFFMDGVLESYTAVVLDGYPDQPDNFGEPIFNADHFGRMASEADRLGLQIFVHACGDGAVRRVLDGYETAQKQNGRRDSRHRVEHIELVHPDDVARFAQLGVIASMQPIHSPIHENDPDVWPMRVRKSDWDRSFAWRTMRDAGAVLAFGSDWPVATPDPAQGLNSALNRQPWEPGHDTHRQTLEEAIAGYTRDAAYAEFQEGKKGQIKVGMWADMVLLSDDIFAMPQEKISDVKAELTLCDGRVVFERAS